MQTIVVQEAMNLMGYDGGPSDGKAGDQTRRGVRDLQERLGLEPTGEIDEKLLTSLGVPLGELARSEEVCVDLEPMPEPPLQCDARTTVTRSETQCGCRYDNMIKRNKTSCSCESGFTLKEGRGCVPIDVPKALVCDAETTVKRGGECVCRRKDMQQISPTQCR